MPFLRFTRDRRGYENTYLVHNVRRRGRDQARVLYWFRTPPQVKVGRAAIDEDAIRSLEELYPDIEFDWERILEARPAEPEATEEPRRGRDRSRDREPREGRRAAVSPLVDKAAAAPVVGTPEPSAATGAPVSEPIEGASVTIPAELETIAEAEHEPEPGGAEEGLPVDLEAGEAAVPAPIAHASEPSAAAQVLGSEGLQRLRARFAEVCARIASLAADDARREALRALADRLNPDAWVTDTDVRAGLEQFELVLDQIRREVGPLRRRTRRGGRRNRRRHDSATAAAPEPAGGPQTARDDDDAGDEPGEDR